MNFKSLLFILFATFAFGQNYNFKNSFDSIEVNQTKRKYTRVNYYINDIKSHALKENKRPEYLYASIKDFENISKQHTKKEDIVKRISPLIEKEIARSKPIDRAFLNFYYANLLFDNINIATTTKNDLSINFIDWTFEKRFKTIDSLLTESIKNVELLENEPTEKWKILLNAEIVNQVLNKEVKISVDKYNQFSLIPTLYNLFGNLYINGIDQLYKNKRFTKENKYQLIANKINPILSKINQLNKEKNYNEARSYQYYRNLDKNNFNEFELLKDTLSKIPADFNAQILYYKLATSFDGNEDISKKFERLNEAIKLYPNSIWTKNLVEFRDNISKPDLEIEHTESYPSNEYIPISINYKKVNELYIRVYKKNYSPKHDEDYTKYDSLTKSYKPTGELIYSEKINLKDFKDYNRRTVLYKINPLASGYYEIFMSNNVDFVDDFYFNIVENNTIQISDYFISAFETEELENGYKYKGQIINRKNGLPFANKTIKLYGDSKKNDFQKVKSINTNGNGEFTYKSNDDSDKREDLDNLYLYIPSTKDFFDLSNSNIDEIHDYSDNEDDIETDATILLDRKIYRPNQEMFFKAILHERNSIKGKILPDVDLTVFIKNPNGEKIDSLNLKTNDFGSISGKFKLPEETLNGSFRIEIHRLNNKNSIHSINFNVEEYKRPTFRVVLEKNKQTLKNGDTATFKGFVESLSGARLNDATIQYYSESNYGTITEDFDTIKTDQNGEFLIKKILKGNEKTDHFILYVTAILQTGESQTTETNYYYGINSVKINLISDEIFINKDWNKITLETENINKIFVPLKGKVTIYKLPEPKGIYGTNSLRFDSAYDLLSQKEKQDFFGNYNLNKKNTTSWNKENIIQQTDFDTNIDKTIKINQPENLKKGYYLVEAISIINNDTISNSRIIKIAEDISYRFSDKEFLTTSVEKASYNIGDTYKVDFETDFDDNAVIYLYIQDQNKFIKTEKLNFKNGKATYSTKITEEMVTNKFRIDYLFIHNNQYKSEFITIPTIQKNHELIVKTEVFRDKIQPNQQETWSLKITNPTNKTANAEVLTTMYDASLDQFRSNNYYNQIDWRSNSYYPFTSRKITERFYNYSSFGSLYQPKNIYPIEFRFPKIKTTLFDDFKDADIDEIVKKASLSYVTTSEDSEDFLYQLNGNVNGLDLAEVVTTGYGTPGAANNMFIRGYANLNSQQQALVIIDGEIKKITDITNEDIAEITVLKSEEATALYGSRGANGVIIIQSKNKNTEEKSIDLSTIKARTNLNETAFFYPSLRTDKEGNVSFDFTTPEALTEWKLLVFAHDKELNSGDGTFITKTQKDLMVSPHLPRYFRENDEMIISTQIQNISDKNLNGNVKLEFINQKNNQIINSEFNVINETQNFEVSAKQTSVIEWKIKIPENYEDVLVKIVAGTSDFSDGEQQILPILSNKITITESQSIVLLPQESKEIKLDISPNQFELFKLKIETNPLFTVLSSLEQLAIYPYDCTEQTTSKWFAYKMLAILQKKYPKIAEYFKTINQKNIPKTGLEYEISTKQTSWNKPAKSQDKIIAEIAKTMDEKYIQKQLTILENKLIKAQFSDGSFPWFIGGKTNLEITKQNLIYIGRLIKFYPENISNDLKKSFSKGLDYLIDYNLNFQKNSIKKQYNLNEFVDVIYIDQFYPTKNKKLDDVKKMYENEWNKIEKTAGNRNLEFRAKSAIVANYLNAKSYATTLVKSIETEMILDNTNGNYWNTNENLFLTNSISTQSLIIEAFEANKMDTKNLVQWILQQYKQNSWHGTLGTNYALHTIISTSDFNENSTKIEIEGIDSSKIQQLFGQNIFETSNLNEIPKSIKIKNNFSVILNGSIVNYKSVPINEIKSNQNKLRVEKNLFIKENNKWIPLNRKIKLGEIVRINLTLISDEDISYVHLKDYRATGFDPVFVPSKYYWNNSVGYYFETKDEETNFFIDYLPKGEHQFGYEVKANLQGKFNNGISQAESMYNQNYKTHTDNKIIEIEK